MVPDNNEVALVPFRGVVTAIPMVGGFLKHLSDDPDFLKIYAEVIFDGDKFKYKIDDEHEHVIYIPAISPDNKMIGAFAGVLYENGRAKYEIARKHEVERIIKINRDRKGHSKAWDQYPEEMVKKYMIKRMSKRILSLQVQDEILMNEDFVPSKPAPASVIDPALITGKKENGKEEALQKSDW